MIAMVYADWTEASTGEIHGSGGYRANSYPWAWRQDLSDARRGLEADSHQVMLAMSKPPALGGIPE